MSDEQYSQLMLRINAVNDAIHTVENKVNFIFDQITEASDEKSASIKHEDLLRMSKMCDKFDALLKEIEENPFTAAKHLKAHKE